MVGSAVLQTATDPNGARIHRHKHSSTQTMTLGLGWAPWTPVASRHDLQNAPMIVLDLTPPSESALVLQELKYVVFQVPSPDPTAVQKNVTVFVTMTHVCLRSTVCICTCVDEVIRVRTQIIVIKFQLPWCASLAMFEAVFGQFCTELESGGSECNVCDN